MADKTAAHAKYSEAVHTRVMPKERLATPMTPPAPVRQDSSPPPAVPRGDK